MSRNTPAAIERGAHFTVAHVGPWSELDQYSFDLPKLGKSAQGKLFLKEALELTGVEMSWNSFPPKAATPFLHGHHENEEVYLFISGQGEFMVNDRIFKIGEGSVVRVSPAGLRAYRNTGNEPLNFIVLQVKEGSLPVSTVEDGFKSDQPLHWPESA
ncbi:MAG TPA: cupin domain-containing protein [Rhodocyclaceae bacterium]|nr:cupin domain-containing protein [Rhodocyclaceae bacterium]